MAKYVRGKRGMRAKRRVRRGTKVSKSFAKKVKKVLAKDTETKTVVFNSNVTAFNQQLNATGDCLRLLPDIANGTAEGQKIGNEIRLQSLNIRGVMSFTLGQTTPGNTRIGVRLLVFRAKKFNDWNQTASDFATSYTRLLEGTALGLQGELSQFNAPTNSDYFSVVVDKRFYMNLSVGATTTESTKTVKFVNFNVPYARRKLTYDENANSVQPNNMPYCMALQYTKLGGEVADAPATTYLTFQYSATAKYEDA